ncbi:ribosomal-protein-alanine N-acetyltransferase [bacterium]|nr:ribosomal-protein-alanine N-acetyltransferase [bacterium]
MRPVQPEDSPLLAELHEASFDTSWKADEFTRMLAQPGMLGYVHIEGEQALGMAFAHAVLDQADIITIAVHPSMRGQGMGRALMETLEKGLAAMGVHHVFLEVRASNRIAISLYESLGYLHQARRPKYYDGIEDGLLMKKSLPTMRMS